MDAHLQELETRILTSGETPEGNCFYQHRTLNRLPILEYKRLNFQTIMKELQKTVSRPKVCEIGVNAGHSLLILLDSCLFGADCTLFDLGEHTYSASCVDYLRSQFPNSLLNIHWGDSKLTLPYWITKHHESLESFDLVHVDGGHTIECIVSDLAMAVQLTKPGGYIIVDDTNDPNIAGMCERWINMGAVKPVLQYYSIVYPHILLKKTEGSS